MDGLRLDRRSEHGRRFARALIDAASERASTWTTRRLGPAGLDIGVRAEDDLAQLVLGAFLPGAPVPAGRFRLAVTRHGELARLPPTEWAREWTDSGRMVPAELTYPYRVFLDRQVGIAYAFDQRSGDAAVWIRREVDLDLRSFITPFRVLLSWMANTIDAEVVHASAAVVGGRAIVFSGASGSGKSTLAMGLGFSGDPLIADDCLLVQGEDVHAVFARAKLDDDAASMVNVSGVVLHSLPRTPRAKRYIDVRDLGSRFVDRHRVETWGFPVIRPTPGHYTVTERHAYRIVVTDSLREVFGGTTRNRLRLARAVRGRPAHRLLLGPSMAENVELVRRVMAESPADRPDRSPGTEP